MHIDARATNLIGAWVLAAGDEMRTAIERVTGMSGGAPAALVAIAAEPGMSIDALRRALDLTHPGTVRLVDRLADRGWVTRGAGIGRAVALQPTPAGLEVHAQLLAARAQALRSLLEDLGEHEVDQLAQVLTATLPPRAQDQQELRRLCRLCDRTACKPCPPWTQLRDTTNETADMAHNDDGATGGGDHDGAIDPGRAGG